MTDTQIQDEIIEALRMAPEDVPRMDTIPPEDSPLNYPVAEKYFEDPPAPEPKADTQSMESANLMADVILGAANNLIEVGGGYFIKIKTDASFHEYAELIQVIEEQNQRNLKRLILDEGDKAMLKPLIAALLKSRQKVVSPEQQLLIGIVSILIKKAQLVMQIRTENQILTEKVRGIIQAETRETEEQSGYVHEAKPQPNPVPQERPKHQDANAKYENPDSRQRNTNLNVDEGMAEANSPESKETHSNSSVLSSSLDSRLNPENHETNRDSENPLGRNVNHQETQRISGIDQEE